LHDAICVLKPGSNSTNIERKDEDSNVYKFVRDGGQESTI